MQPVNFYLFFYSDELGKRVKSTWRMTMEEAPQWLKNPEPDLASLEVRMLPESEAEFAHTNCLAGPAPTRLDLPESAPPQEP